MGTLRFRLTYLGFLLALCIFWYRAGLGYTFWEDDWNYFWLINEPLRYPIVSWLHPGTMVQFHLLTRLFGYEPFPWMATGILLKAFAAFSVAILTSVLTRNKTAGIAGGIAFAVIPLGLESVHWPSAFIVNLDVFLLGVAAASYVRSVRERTAMSLTGKLAAAGAFLADPMRALSLLWIPFAVRKRPAFRFGRRVMVYLAVAVAAVTYAELAFMPAYTRWYRGYFFDEPWAFGQRIIGFLTALGTALTGWFVPLGHNMHELSRSDGSMIAAGTGLLAVITLAVMARYGRGTGIIRFTGFWILSTLLVQWLSDPDYIPAVTHRHLALPLAGLSVLTGYVLANVPAKARIAGLVIIMAAWMTASRAFTEWDRYRKAANVNANTALLERLIRNDVPAPFVFLENSDNPLIGPDDYRQHLQLLWSRRGDTRLATFVMDYQRMMGRMCEITGYGILNPATDLTAVSVSADGIMTDITGEIRKKISEDPDVAELCRMQGAAL